MSEEKRKKEKTLTFEEIQQIIEGMLSVQRELQTSQLEFKSSLTELRDDISELRATVADLRDVSQQHERRIEQLIGYSITGESDKLDLDQRLRNVERRLTRLERDDNRNQS